MGPTATVQAYMPLHDDFPMGPTTIRQAFIPLQEPQEKETFFVSAFLQA
jgi:hypothetical protein